MCIKDLISAFFRVRPTKVRQIVIGDKIDRADDYDDAPPPTKFADIRSKLNESAKLFENRSKLTDSTKYTDSRSNLNDDLASINEDLFLVEGGITKPGFGIKEQGDFDSPASIQVNLTLRTYLNDVTLIPLFLNPFIRLTPKTFNLDACFHKVTLTPDL